MRKAIWVGVAALGAWAAPSFAQQKITGPIAEYWMSVSTTTGMAAALGGGGRPSMGGMMSMVLHGGPNFSAVNHSLTLQLGSRQSAAAPQADHMVPSVLGVGPDLPLLTPQAPPPAPPSHEESSPVEKYRQQKPRGRMLIFWGCGEHAAPGQPYIIDFAKMTSDPASMVKMISVFKSFPVTPEQAPSVSNSATFGEWPNSKSTIPIPTNGSLVGEHVVHGDYAPDIHFTLQPQNDFMGPIALTTNARTPTGSTALAWQPVPGAKAYLATVFGAGAEDTILIWTSSEAQIAAFGLPQYLNNEDIRRLVAGRELMGADATSCTVPAEVGAVAAQGILSMTAFGGELNFSDPPRPASPRTPWNIAWTAKVRYRSSTTALLGHPMPGVGAAAQPQAPPSAQDKMKSVLQGLGSFIPH